MADVSAQPEFTYANCSAARSRHHDDTQYRLISTEGVDVRHPEGTFLKVDPEAIRRLTAEAMHDIAHYLRSAHLQQLRNILDDPEASDNDRFVALDLLKRIDRRWWRAADVPGHRHSDREGQEGPARVHGGGDEPPSPTASTTVPDVEPALQPDAPLDMYTESARAANLPAEIRSAVDGDAYSFLFMAKGGGSANKSYLYQETKVLLNEATLLPWIFDDAEPRHLGLPAVPPAVVIGGTSAEFAVETAKLASTKYSIRCRPRAGCGGHGFRDVELEKAVRSSPRRRGIGAQFGGKYFCRDVRIIRSPPRRRAGRHRRVVLGRPSGARRSPRTASSSNSETDPARFLPDVTEEHLGDHEDREAVHRSQPSRWPRSAPNCRRSPVTSGDATGPMIVARDIAHAKIKERLDAGELMFDYLRDQPLLRRPPSPPGMRRVRSPEPGRDSYVEQFQAAGGSMVMLAKGNRSKQVTDSCRARRLTSARIGGPRPARSTTSARSTCSSTRTRHGGDLEDRGRGLPGVRGGRRQGPRLLRRRPRPRLDARLDQLTLRFVWGRGRNEPRFVWGRGRNEPKSFSRRSGLRRAPRWPRRR
jgi:fumarate hydratase class I